MKKDHQMKSFNEAFVRFCQAELNAYEENLLSIMPLEPGENIPLPSLDSVFSSVSKISDITLQDIIGDYDVALFRTEVQALILEMKEELA
jgi:hypothetical protein